MDNKINAPSHYVEGRRHQPIDVIERWGLHKNHYLACVVKYISRYQRKGDPLGDLNKAVWYAKRAEVQIKFDEWAEEVVRLEDYKDESFLRVKGRFYEDLDDIIEDWGFDDNNTISSVLYEILKLSKFPQSIKHFKEIVFYLELEIKKVSEQLQIREARGQ